MYKLQHLHLLVRGFTNKELTDCDKMESTLQHIVNYIDMKEVIAPRAHYVNKPGNRGITAQIGIETSHIALHVWDEVSPSLMQLDLYTCGCLELEDTLFVLQNQFELTKFDYWLIDRMHGFQLIDVGSR